MKSEKVTMKDIATEAGVSVTTVSKILNNVDMHISEATRKKVLGLVEQHHYVPNEIAKGLRNKRSNTIGVITYDITDPFVSKMLTGIESVCKEKGIGVLVCSADLNHASELDNFSFLNSKMVDGIISLGLLSSKSEKDIIEKYVSMINLPIVAVDRDFYLDIPGMGIVDPNALEAAYKVTELLIQKGCRAISYIGPSPTTHSSARVEGYFRALKDSGRKINEKLIYQKDDFNCETGMQGVTSLFSSKEKIDGIVCANDLVAMGAILALNQKGLRVPEDVKVTGIDNIYISQYLNPPLTTVDLHGCEVGVACANMLISQILDKVPLGKKTIHCELVMRESV